MLDVVVDKAGVTSWRVEAFAQIFEENPNEHCANGQPYDGQPKARLRLGSFLGIGG
jgi:hypothetical protein